MSLNVFPSEALLLGECLGEYLQEAEYEDNKRQFLDFIRKRLLPAIPPLAAARALRGLIDIGELPKKSLVELILIRLANSIAKSTADDLFGLDENYDVAMELLRLGAVLKKQRSSHFPEFQVPDSVLDIAGSDDTGAIKNLIEGVARENGYLELHTTGMRFGALIAQCQSVDRMIREHKDYVWKNGETFTIGDYVSAEQLKELTECEHVKSTGIGEHLLTTAIRLLGRKFTVTRRHDVIPLIVDAVGQLLAFLWQSFGQVVGYFREMDLEAQAEDQHSLMPRADRLTPKSTRDDVHLAIRAAEQRLAEEIAEPGRAEMIVRDLAFAIEALAKRLWPGNFGRGSSISQILHDKLRSEDTRERRFASAALSLYLSYRNDAVHDAANFRCSYVEARFFVVGLRALLEIYDSLSESRLRPN